MESIEEALATVKVAGYAVLKEKSYRQAQERQRIAQAQAEWERESAEHSRSWARDCLDKERKLSARCTYLYGLACKLGATPEQLRGEDEDAQKTNYLDALVPIAKYNYQTGEWDTEPALSESFGYQQGWRDAMRQAADG